MGGRRGDYCRKRSPDGHLGHLVARPAGDSRRHPERGFGIGLQHDANGLFVLAIGALLWLAGHWHYALRHHEYKSPPAGYVFGCWAPDWLDPTRDWAIPVADSGAEGRTP